MARRTTVSVTSDLSGRAAAETVSFALDGVSYEIDLTAREGKQLRAELAAYIDSGRRVPRARRSNRTGSNDRARLEDIRNWAQGNGYQVANRGRIPQRVLEAYQAAH